MSKIMIVGGAGFIGSHLTKRLMDEGHEVLVYDQNAGYNYDAFVYNEGTVIDKRKKYEYEYRLELCKGADRCTGNENSLASLYSAVFEFEPEYFFYAGGISVPAQVNPLSMQKMISGFMNCYFLFSNSGYSFPLTKFIFLSSSLVYTRPHSTWEIHENDDRSCPKNLYGITKNLCETVLETGDVPFNTVRLCGVYGPGDGNERVLDKLITRACRGDKLEVKNNTYNTFTYITDVINGLESLIYKGCPGTAYNLTGNESVLLENAAEIIIEKLHSPSQIGLLPRKDSDTSKGPFSLGRAEDDLDYQPDGIFLQNLDFYINHIQLREGIIVNEA